MEQSNLVNRVSRPVQRFNTFQRRRLYETGEQLCLPGAQKLGQDLGYQVTHLPHINVIMPSSSQPGQIRTY